MIGSRDEKIIKAFGNNLKNLRKARKWSIRKLALEADIEHSTVRRIEKGESNASMTSIVKLAEALGVHPGEFFVKK